MDVVVLAPHTHTHKTQEGRFRFFGLFDAFFIIIFYFKPMFVFVTLQPTIHPSANSLNMMFMVISIINSSNLTWNSISQSMVFFSWFGEVVSCSNRVHKTYTHNQFGHGCIGSQQWTLTVFVCAIASPRSLFLV